MNTQADDLDLEIKRTQLARDKLALAAEQARSARRQQTVNLAHTAAATTAEIGEKAARVAAGPLRWAFGFCLRFAQAATCYLVLVLMWAQESIPAPNGDYLYRLGYRFGSTWMWGLAAAILLAALSRSRR